MLFNTFPFVWLFLATFVVYYLPFLRRWQVGVLIVASFIFYGYSSPKLLILLVSSIALNTLTSYQVAKQPHPARRWWAFAGVLVNLGILGFFKYAGLLTSLALGITHAEKGQLAQYLTQIPLPIGISFYTFEGISLLLDVWRKKDGACVVTSPGGNVAAASTPGRHLRNTALFIAFFPHLIAGPILKAAGFYPQITAKRFRDIPWTVVFRALVTGYFLKMVVADNLKDYTFWIAYPYYRAIDSVTNCTLLFGYSIQIFADFAGYSLIAIGLGGLFGYTLPQNFNMPYISRSIGEFWRRWHISLSTWLRDYLYIPLGGNRLGGVRTYINLMLVMLLGGLWHGAALSYMFWGGYHGIGLATERFFAERREAGNLGPAARPGLLLSAAQMLGVFLFVTLGWLFFKLTDFGYALDFLRVVAQCRIAPNPGQIIAVALFSFPVIVYHLHYLCSTGEEGDWPALLVKQFWPVMEPAALGLMLTLLVVDSGSSHAFIYFQF
jgi:alginate O-acetyltransferase complex protein AlgI